MQDLDLETSKIIAKACEEKAKQINVPMNIAIVNSQGRLIFFERMDKAWLGSIDIAQAKAYTAASFCLSTRELGKLSQPGQPLYGINAGNQGKIIIFAGGLPIFNTNNELIGAVGVSGGTIDQDEEVAKAGINAFLGLSNQKQKTEKQTDFSF